MKVEREGGPTFANFRSFVYSIEDGPVTLLAAGDSNPLGLKIKDCYFYKKQFLFFEKAT